MKQIALLIALIFATNTMAGLPPTTSGGIKSTTKTTTFNFKAPNNLATKVDSTTVLMESGNKNLLTNGSFEALAFSSSWSFAGSASTSGVSTPVIDGKKAFYGSLSSSSFQLYQTSTLYVPDIQGLQLVAGAFVLNSVPGMQMCSVNDGVISTSNCTSLSTDSAFHYYELPFVASTTDNGVAFTISGGGTASGEIIIDDVFVGSGAGKFPAVAQSQLLGTVTITGCASAWSTTSTSFASFATQTGCVYTTSGQALAPTTNIPGIRFASLGPGEYKLEAEGKFSNSASGADSVFQFYDGSSASREQSVFAASGSALVVPGMSHSIGYTSSKASTTIELRAKHISGTSSVFGTTTNPLVIRVWYTPPAHATYTQPNNQDTGWVSCGLTTSDFTGFGTVSSIQDQCKKDGEDLLMRVKFTSGTSTATEARVALKLMGAALTAADTSKIASIQVVGNYFRNATTTGHGGAILQEPSVTYVTFSASGVFGNQSTNALSKDTGVGVLNASEGVSFTARVPIAGWQKSQITGTFKEVNTTVGISKPKKCWANFGGAGTLTSGSNCTSTPCTVYAQSGGSCGSVSVTRSSTGTYICAWPASTWAVSTRMSIGGSLTVRTVPVLQSITSGSDGSYQGAILGVTSAFAASDGYGECWAEGQAP